MPDRPYYITWSKQDGAPTLPVVAAENDELILSDGRRIYDFSSTSFQAAFGHSHPVIQQKIREQLQIMPMASPKAEFPLKSAVSERLLKRLNLPKHGKLFYTVSGAESVENALKIARQVSRRPLILARNKSYHGASLGAMSVSGDWRSDAHLTFAAGTLRIPEPSDDPNAMSAARIIETAGPETIAAIIVEPISGTNGVNIPPQTWVDGIQFLCRQHQIKIIVDEVFCGFGRTGADFAFQHFGWQPDLVCLSKAISGGYIPLGAVWTSPEIAEFYRAQTLVCGLTNYAHPLGLAALDGVLDILDSPDYQTNKSELEQKFASGVEQLATVLGAQETRCRGLLAAIEWKDWQLPLWYDFLDAGLFVFTKQNMLILAPPLVSHPARLQSAFAALTLALTKSRDNPS